MMQTDKYPVAELLDGLRQAAADRGEPLTVKAYDDFRADHAGLASGIWVIRRFGTWGEACRLAGVQTNTTRSTSRRWNADDLVGWVADYLTSSGPAGSYNGYVAWAREVEGAPSGPTLRNTFGWAEVRQLAKAVLDDRALGSEGEKQ